ncbi:MAG TPA: histidine phosphatase family protein [Luteibacter sp.]|nr:histidine phosphatase family protein [Luteibacter sp.]
MADRQAHGDGQVGWPAHLWIVRHGQSAGNVARDRAEASGAPLIELGHRDADVPLSGLGREQSEALAAWVAGLPADRRPTVFLSSPYVRAQQTCRIVAEAIGAGDDIVVDERLREKEFGVLDRYTRHGILEHFPDLAAQRKLVGKFYFRPPGGESWCDVVLRLRSVSSDLQRNYARERVFVVGHQVIVNCFRFLLERMDEATILAIDSQGDVPNCAITDYRDAGPGRGLQLVDTNVVYPLEKAGSPVTRAADTPAGAR